MAKLNFQEDNLQPEVKGLYAKLYQGMRSANETEAPDFSNPPLTSDGQIDEDKINKKLAQHTDTLMKNSAYMFANSIASTLSGDSGGSGGDSDNAGYVSRSGDSMLGLLSANNGFKAGIDGKTILALQDNVVEIKSNLNVLKEISCSSKLNVPNVRFADSQFVRTFNNALQISAPNIELFGKIKAQESIKVGNIIIERNNIYNHDHEYYHAGNSNLNSVDWTMRNANVSGNIITEGNSTTKGLSKMTGGIELWHAGKKLLCSTASPNPKVELSSDLDIIGNHGIMFNDKYIVKVRDSSNKVVSFAAPGMVMNLGDSDGETPTKHIALQTGIYNYNGAYEMISSNGDGNFPNSFKAGSGNAGITVIHTFHTPEHDGIVLPKELRFTNVHGVGFYEKDNKLVGVGKHTNTLEELKWTIGFNQTTSLFADLSNTKSSTLRFNTEADFVSFDKPIEAPYISVKSNKYKTRLIENTLFFDNNKFIEGIKDGLRHSQNSYFDGNVGSLRFASGFAGYGWAIKENATTGNIEATFDRLTIRKKMRAYELEVQKSSVTNGALWVSDSCSGDEVIAL